MEVEASPRNPPRAGGYEAHLENAATVKHELWDEGDGNFTFCLAGPRGDEARKLLPPGAKVVWRVEADSHFEAMTAYYQFMG